MFIRFEQEQAMSDKEKVKIVKVDGDGSIRAPPPPVKPVVGTSRKRSMKTFPRGVLKGGKTAKAKSKARFEPVRDPAKAPPLRKATLRILTEQGAEKRRKQIKKTVRSMPVDKVRHVLKASGMPVSEKTPPEVAREILEGGMEAGMIVVK
jgi:hypothetical protein